MVSYSSRSKIPLTDRTPNRTRRHANGLLFILSLWHLWRHHMTSSCPSSLRSLFRWSSAASSSMDPLHLFWFIRAWSLLLNHYFFSFSLTVATIVLHNNNTNSHCSSFVLPSFLSGAPYAPNRTNHPYRSTYYNYLRYSLPVIASSATPLAVHSSAVTTTTSSTITFCALEFHPSYSIYFFIQQSYYVLQLFHFLHYCGPMLRRTPLHPIVCRAGGFFNRFPSQKVRQPSRSQACAQRTPTQRSWLHCRLQTN